MDESDMVIVGSNPKKFLSSLLETLYDKVSEIQDDIKDCYSVNPQKYEHWVMIINEPLESFDSDEFKDEDGFVHVLPSSLKQKTDDLFYRLWYLQRSINEYKSSQKGKANDETINNEINKNEKLQFRMEQLDKQINYFETEAKRLKEKVSTLELQKEGLLTRLSEVAGLRLSDNNPDIQDLSDPKRPTKIVEAFGELYDNEWTNALEDLLKSQRSEREAIDTLAGILKTVFETCKTFAKSQRMALLKDMTFCGSYSESDLDALPQVLRNKIKTLQKDSAMDIYPFVKRQVEDRINYASLGKGVKEYADRCAELSWLMNVQDPPLVLNFAAVSGEPVDKKKFTVYTKNGSVVDFIVWPAVMYENETIFRKGVLQAK